MFCVGLCIALSVQMTIVVLDRLQHVFQVEHAPNALAGPVYDHGHHLKNDVPQLVVEVSFDDGDHRHAEAHAHGEAHAHTHGEAHTHAHADDTPQGGGYHTHEWLPQGHEHGPITHHHHGSGMLTPWLVSAPVQIAGLPARIPVLDHAVTGHPDAPAWRRDRPPKLNLERIV